MLEILTTESREVRRSMVRAVKVKARHQRGLRQEREVKRVVVGKGHDDGVELRELYVTLNSLEYCTKFVHGQHGGGDAVVCA